ncbi:NUDIX domain-containing protein [Echinicola vietnamensis]|uniref:GDP-mannose pyrophosphatase n=1 Tax=Echinicola vietnamensis (strain DSM 17526 / LMG 23754 / KMM 6221) TaxID=926556 RepID=L0FX16_ECHVK|nr:NUDIX hydrolase [Echinicola vietnamensis]AGA78444.1 ADP-ribose pyrophosphatase [Echinicola vietnamensis DSM 17526]
MEENPWKTKTRKLMYSNPWIALEEHEVVTPAGTDGVYGKVSFKNKAMAILPVDEELNTWLVGQFRYAIDEYSWEIPEGGSPIGEDILEGAKRELKEETGLAADKWTPIMRFHTSNSVTDEEGFAYLAEGLTEGETAFEDTEKIEVKKLPLKAVVQMVMDGEITDVISVAVILKAARMLGI